MKDAREFGHRFRVPSSYIYIYICSKYAKTNCIGCHFSKNSRSRIIGKTLKHLAIRLLHNNFSNLFYPYRSNFSAINHTKVLRFGNNWQENKTEPWSIFLNNRGFVSSTSDLFRSTLKYINYFLMVLSMTILSFLLTTTEMTILMTFWGWVSKTFMHHYFWINKI